MSASKIGSPFEVSRDGEEVTNRWDGEVFRDALGCALDWTTKVLRAAIEAWKPTPPEGWEEYPEGEKLGKPEGLFNPLTGKVLAVNEHGNARLSETMWASYSDCTTLGFVPVRKVKPAVPKWTKQIAFELGLIPEGSEWFAHAEKYLAAHCVPKADADEMLPRLRRLHAYLSPGDIRDDVAALIERMEGKS